MIANCNLGMRRRIVAGTDVLFLMTACYRGNQKRADATAKNTIRKGLPDWQIRVLPDAAMTVVKSYGRRY
jgi:hypothetical protein